MNSETPFVLLFEEISTQDAEPSLQPVYDEEEGLSYIIDPATGTRVPFVTFTTTGETVTNLTTRAGIDTQDRDWVEDSLIGMGTKTLTKVVLEETDSDEV